MYLVSNFCNLVSANELTSELDFSSVNMTKKYMDYLHEPCLSRYNNKLKLMKQAPRKVYVVDDSLTEEELQNNIRLLRKVDSAKVWNSFLVSSYNLLNSFLRYNYKVELNIEEHADLFA